MQPSPPSIIQLQNVLSSPTEILPIKHSLPISPFHQPLATIILLSDSMPSVFCSFLNSSCCNLGANAKPSTWHTVLQRVPGCIAEKQNWWGRKGQKYGISGAGPRSSYWTGSPEPATGRCVQGSHMVRLHCRRPTGSGTLKEWEEMEMRGVARSLL